MAIDRYYKQSKVDINKPVREGMMSKIDTENHIIMDTMKEQM